MRDSTSFHDTERLDDATRDKTILYRAARPDGAKRCGTRPSGFTGPDVTSPSGRTLCDTARPSGKTGPDMTERHDKTTHGDTRQSGPIIHHGTPRDMT